VRIIDSTGRTKHYNYYRDYDPSIGRYVESDPVGLKGGPNTFAYVYDSPLVFTDKRGLRGGPGIPGWGGGRSPSGSSTGVAGFYGGEGHFFGGGGLTSVTCRDKCGNPQTFRYWKVCFGAAIGFSGGGGGVIGMDGDNCNADRYKGWFFELGASAGYASAGVDIGYNDDGPFGFAGSLSGVGEASIGGGFGAKGKATWCYYVPM
jgi:RHS repeat-associated protein